MKIYNMNKNKTMIMIMKMISFNIYNLNEQLLKSVKINSQLEWNLN